VGSCPGFASELKHDATHSGNGSHSYACCMGIAPSYLANGPAIGFRTAKECMPGHLFRPWDQNGATWSPRGLGEDVTCPRCTMLDPHVRRRLWTEWEALEFALGVRLDGIPSISFESDHTCLDMHFKEWTTHQL
jgi:hypothetical protein